MVVILRITLRTVADRFAERESVLDTGSRWTWISKRLAEDLGVRLSAVKRAARTADDRIVEGLLADEPLDVSLPDFKVHLWVTPCVAEWLARDVIVGNDFMDKAGIRLVKDRVEAYEPVGELFHLWSL